MSFIILNRVVEYDAVFLFVILTVAKSYTCVFEGCGIVCWKHQCTPWYLFLKSVCAVLAICTFSVNNSTMESLYRWRVMLVQMEILFNSDENAFYLCFCWLRWCLQPVISSKYCLLQSLVNLRIILVLWHHILFDMRFYNFFIEKIDMFFACY